MTRLLVFSAWVATFVFALLTFWTGYPFLVDDYGFIFQSYLADFNLLSFSYMLTQRPVAVLQSYFCYRYHVFENTKILFWIYYFFHSLGVLGIFNWLLTHLGSPALRAAYFTNQPDASAKKWQLIVPATVIATTIALYPNWYEINLMALDLPYGFGVPLLAAALYCSRQWLRILFFTLSFLSLETYIFPAYVLLLLPELAKLPGIKGKKFISNGLRASVPWFIALGSFLIVEKTIGNFTHAISYSISLKSLNLSMLGPTIKLLWTLHFYKINWVSTVLEWTALSLIVGRLLSAREKPLPIRSISFHCSISGRRPLPPLEQLFRPACDTRCNGPQGGHRWIGDLGVFNSNPKPFTQGPSAWNDHTSLSYSPRIDCLLARR